MQNTKKTLVAKNINTVYMLLYKPHNNNANHTKEKRLNRIAPFALKRCQVESQLSLALELGYKIEVDVGQGKCTGWY